MKSYPVTWDGRLVLACRKCQKKLKGVDELKALASLKKTAKRRGKALHVVNVGCMDLCPKNGVTVCVPSQDAERLVVLRKAEDVDELAG